MGTANKLLTRVPVSYALDWVGTSRVSLRSMLGVALSDEQYVRDQYRSTENLDVRTSVWRSDVEGGSPHDVAERALREVGARRVLEIGSGTGTFASRIQTSLPCNVIAIDSSAVMVEMTKSRGVEALIADARALPFEDDTFDAVVAAWMLYHVDPLDQALGEITRVLRPGGRFVAITNGRDHLAELWSLVGEIHDEPGFSRENGAQKLESHFASVEQLDITTYANFADYGAAAAYLSSMDRKDLAARLPVEGWPMRACGSVTVFVADVA